MITFRAMGCQMNVWLDGPDDSILQQVPVWVEDFEQMMSRFRPDSDLSILNQQAGRWVQVKHPLFEVIHAAKHAARQTDGLYNPLVLPAMIASGYDRSFELIAAGQTLPAEESASEVADWHEIELDVENERVWLPAGIDLGGIGKGWTAQQIADQLAPYGSCLVDAGGDLVARGETAWTVAVAEPGTDETAEPVALIRLRNAAVATSGIDYRRWQQGDRQQHHLIDPRTGHPAETDVLAATVVHPHAPTAEAYAKAVLLLGSDEGLNWLTQQWDAAGLVVRQDGAVLITTNFASVITEGNPS